MTGAVGQPNRLSDAVMAAVMALTRRNSSSLFYLPVQAMGGEGNSYFLDLPGKELDPVLWVRNAIVHDPLDVRPALEFEEHEDQQHAPNCRIGVSDLLARIARQGRPDYDNWTRMTWATIRVLNGDRDTAVDLMKRFFPEEQQGEYKMLAKDWNPIKKPWLEIPELDGGVKGVIGRGGGELF